MAEQINARIHNVIIEQRRKLNLSGVTDVLGFEDETIVLNTVMGSLTVKGEQLHIGSFSTASGDIDIDGKIIALVYTDDDCGKGGFFRRLKK